MNKPLNEYRLAVVDLEMTGLSNINHEIIEIGVLIYDQQLDKITKEWDIKIAPSHIETASEYSLKINGYNDNPELYTSSLKSALIKFNSLTKNCIMVGQNIKFDLGFLEVAMQQFDIKPLYSKRHLDTMSLSWWIVKDKTNSLSLTKLCDHFKISNAGAHSALTDCRRTFELYQKLEKLYKDL